MSVTQATLTLPGIAGLILTLAVAVDANVLIFERMRDEVRAGKSPIMAADAGFSRAMGTIVDANVTTLVAAGHHVRLRRRPRSGLCLDAVDRRVHLGVHLGDGEPATHRLVVPRHPPQETSDLSERTHGLAPDQAAPAENQSHLRQVRAASWRVISATLVVASLVGVIFKPGLNLGIDFKGGSVMEVSTSPRAVDLGKVRRSARNPRNSATSRFRSSAPPDQALWFASRLRPVRDPGVTLTNVKTALKPVAG